MENYSRSDGQHHLGARSINQPMHVLGDEATTRVARDHIWVLITFRVLLLLHASYNVHA